MFVPKEKGQGAVEYALISVFVILILAAAVSYFVSPQAKDNAQGAAEAIGNMSLNQPVTLYDQVEVITHVNATGGIKQEELKGKVANVLVTAAPSACFLNMSMIVYWYTEADPYKMLNKEFEHENKCIASKSDLSAGLRNLHEQISKWIKDAHIDPVTVQKWIQPYLDDLFNLSIDVLKL